MNQLLSKRILVILTFFSTFTFGQIIEILDTNVFSNKALYPDAFDFVIPQYEIPTNAYVGTLRGRVTSSGASNLGNLFNSFWHTANKLGANTFKVDTVFNLEDTTVIDVSVYNLLDYEFDKMMQLYPTNMVYVIGAIDNTQKPKKVKFNSTKILLKPMKYIAYQNEINKEATVSIGGFLGEKLWIKGRKNRLPEFLSLSGFGVGLGTGNFNSVGINFNTGRIYPMDLNFGQFLIHVLDEN